MRKGVTALQNVAALKLAAEAGIYVEWLALCGFPGETAASYDATAALVPRILHLQPPATLLRARADRFSPFFHDPDSFGVTLDPLPAYRHIYPFAPEVIRRLGYHFTMRSAALDRTGETTRAAADAFALWSRHHGESALWVEDDEHGSLVQDRRWGTAPQTWRLDSGSPARDLLALAAQPVSWRAILTHLDHSETALRDTADWLDARGLVLREGEHLLSLPLRQPGFRRAPSWPEIRAGRITPFGATGLMARDAVQGVPA
jgi:hypothetical protein